MSEEEKKAFMLLKSLIFHYHGLDEDEKKLLETAAERYQANSELKWAIEFLAEDYLSAFNRSKEFLGKVFMRMKEEERLKHLLEIWEENYEKGYVTEMETNAILNIAKDWAIDLSFMRKIKN